MTLEHFEKPFRREKRDIKNPIQVDVIILTNLFGVRFGSEGSTWLDFALGELSEVCHHTEIVHFGVAHVLGIQHLQDTKEEQKGNIG